MAHCQCTKLALRNNWNKHSVHKAICTKNRKGGSLWYLNCLFKCGSQTIQGIYNAWKMENCTKYIWGISKKHSMSYFNK